MPEPVGGGGIADHDVRSAERQRRGEVGSVVDPSRNQPRFVCHIDAGTGALDADGRSLRDQSEYGPPPLQN
jgi:hypothetical protein